MHPLNTLTQALMLALFVWHNSCSKQTVAMQRQKRRVNLCKVKEVFLWASALFKASLLTWKPGKADDVLFQAFQKNVWHPNTRQNTRQQSINACIRLFFSFSVTHGHCSAHIVSRCRQIYSYVKSTSPSFYLYSNQCIIWYVKWDWYIYVLHFL